MERSKIRYYTQAAVLVALAIIIRRFIVPQQSFGLNLGGLPIILSGLILGPAGGALVGAVSDVLGIFVSPQPFSFLFTITAALTGALPAAVLLGLPRERRLTFVSLLMAVLVGQLITKVWLVPFFANLAFNKPIWPMALKNLVTELWHAPLYTFLLLPVLRAYRNAFDRDPAILCVPGRYD